MIPCVRFHASVIVQPPTPTLARLLCAVDMTARMMGIDLTVTCGREGHPPTDPHSHGAALDVSVANLSPDLLVRSYHYFGSILGDLFTVLYEVPTQPTLGSLANIAYVNTAASGPHFHLQPKKGTVYPPQDAPTTETKNV